MLNVDFFPFGKYLHDVNFGYFAGKIVENRRLPLDAEG